MNVKRRSPTRGSTTHSCLLISERSPLPQEGRRKSRSPESYSPREARMSTTDIIAEFESGDFDFDDTRSTDSTPFCGLFMNQELKTSNGPQIKSLEKFEKTRNKNFVDWSTRNQRNYAAETANTDTRRVGSSYSRGPQAGGFSGYRGRTRYANRGFSNPTTGHRESRGLRNGPAHKSSKT